MSQPSLSHPAKQRLRRAFENAVPSYDGASAVQRRVCDRLAAELPSFPDPDTLLDAGCGTGYGLRLLRARYPQARALALDLAPAMLARVGGDARRLVGDVERLPLADRSVDLYWSSLTLQWCDLAAALGEAARVLRAGGRLAVATLGPDTFRELRLAFAAADSHRHTLDFATPARIAATAAGFFECRFARQTEVAHYPDLKALLRAIKAMGANQVGGARRTGLLSRGAWQRVESAYEALREAPGLPLSYDVITLHAVRGASPKTAEPHP